jgi:pteridine reductase
MELKQATALVTGGAIRLGRAIALALAKAGTRVAIHYNSSNAKAEATLAEIRALGAEGHAIQGNLALVEDAERVVDTALEKLGGLTILVNNAGIWGATPLGTVTPERWAELFDTNVRSAFFATQRAAPALKAAKGAVLNIADVGIFDPWRNYTPYLTTKGAVATMTTLLAKDLAPEVRVNAIAPGPVLLPDDYSEAEIKKIAKTVLLKRIGSAEDIAQAAIYLLTADYVTGVILPVDGGQRLE